MNSKRKCDSQGFVKGEELSSNPYLVGWLEKYSLHIKDKSKDI